MIVISKYLHDNLITMLTCRIREATDIYRKSGEAQYLDICYGRVSMAYALGAISDNECIELMDRLNKAAKRF